MKRTISRMVPMTPPICLARLFRVFVCLDTLIFPLLFLRVCICILPKLLYLSICCVSFGFCFASARATGGVRYFRVP